MKYFWGSLKNPIFKGDGRFTKNQYRGGGLPKRGAWTVCRFKGGLSKKEGVDTPMHTIVYSLEQGFGVEEYQILVKSWQ